MSVSAQPFTFKAWAPPPADLVKDNLKKLGVEEDEEVQVFKTLLTDLKKSADESKDGVIDLLLFARIGELKVCQTQEAKFTDAALKSTTNAQLCERDVKESLEGLTKMKKNYNHK